MSRDIREAAGKAEKILLRIADAKIPAIERLAIQKTLDKAKEDLRLAKAVRAKISIADEFKLCPSSSNSCRAVFNSYWAVSDCADRLVIGDRGRGEFRMRNYMRVISVENPHCYVKHERTWGIREW
jgi:hypothetical protein